MLYSSPKFPGERLLEQSEILNKAYGEHAGSVRLVSHSALYSLHPESLRLIKIDNDDKLLLINRQEGKVENIAYCLFLQPQILF